MPTKDADVFYTFFVLAALSLMAKYDLELIHPMYVIHDSTIQKNFPALI